MRNKIYTFQHQRHKMKIKYLFKNSFVADPSWISNET